MTLLRIALSLCLSLFAAGGAASAEPWRVIAFGDSITRGLGDGQASCTSEHSGYPRRLKDRLLLSEHEVDVINEGMCGETTGEGLSRIDEVLDVEDDVVLLMEGTNDISGWVSLFTIRYNIAEMARKAEEKGVEPIILSTVPRGPGSGRDNDNEVTEALAGWLELEAEEAERRFADPFTDLMALPDLFETFYDDPWHPNSHGYAQLAIVVDQPVREALDALAVEPGEQEPSVLECDPEAEPAPCQADDDTLCLRDGRFALDVGWRDFEGGEGLGTAAPLSTNTGSGDTGTFWFFSAANTELVVKILDGRNRNDHFWVFYGSLSNVAFSLRVRDTETGLCRIYDNPLDNFASVGDTLAFPSGEEDPQEPAPASAPATLDVATTEAEPAAAACDPAPDALCLAEGRFRVEVAWTNFQGKTGAGTAVALSERSGYFWFFKETNVELVLKALDGRQSNGHFWIFYGALSNVAYTITVTDTVTGAVRTYDNPAGTFASVGDTAAFPEDP